jgi:hypothetical protein
MRGRKALCGQAEAVLYQRHHPIEDNGRGLGIAAAHEKNILSNSMHETTTADEERPQQLGPPTIYVFCLPTLCRRDA